MRAKYTSDACVFILFKGLRSEAGSGGGGGGGPPLGQLFMHVTQGAHLVSTTSIMADLKVEV